MLKTLRTQRLESFFTNELSKIPYLLVLVRLLVKHVYTTKEKNKPVIIYKWTAKTMN